MVTIHTIPLHGSHPMVGVELTNQAIVIYSNSLLLLVYFYHFLYHLLKVNKGKLARLKLDVLRGYNLRGYEGIGEGF